VDGFGSGSKEQISSMFQTWSQIQLPLLALRPRFDGLAEIVVQEIERNHV
jgi:hypothetical protein